MPGASTQMPFGAPEAANEGASPSPFVGIGSDDVAGRIFVGRIGAGKTRCLLEARDRLRRQGGALVTAVDFDLPNMTFVTRIAEGLTRDPQEVASVWQRLWRRAIVRSALAHALQTAGVLPRDADTEALVARVHTAGAAVHRDLAVPRSIYAEFESILRENDTPAELRRFLALPQWDELDFCFERLVERAEKPLCFFLDTIDDESSESPLYWVLCQKGLVMQVLRYAQSQSVSENLQIYIGIRDRTWSALRERIRPALLEQHPIVHSLRWDAPRIKGFLQRKVASLPEPYRFHELNGGHEIAGWLGTDTIRNASRSVDEEVTTYILRHTRLVPRDVVMVGNFLSEQVVAARANGLTRVSDERVRAAVAKSAGVSGREEIYACALEIMEATAAGNAASQAREHLPERVQKQVYQLLERCRDEIFDADRLRALEESAVEQFGADAHLSVRLWKHGLIGCGASSEGPFEFSGDPDLQWRDSLPDARWIAVHPCMFDALGLRPVSAQPIVPFSEALI
jgi:hypothetical protein